MQTRKWTDQQGQERYSTEVVLSRYKGEMTLLDSKGEIGGSSHDFDTSPLGSTADPFSASLPGSGPKFDDLNDDIPF